VTATALFAAAILFGAGEPETDNARCGSHCLYVALRALDVPIGSFAELEVKCGPPTTDGYSLGKLDEVAKSYGLHTLGVRTSFENLKLREGRFACIAHLEDPPHFVNFADADDAGSVCVIDPPRTYTAPADTLQMRWKGNALLLSTKPLAPEENLRAPWSWREWLVAGGLPLLVIFGVLTWRRMRSSD